MWPAAARGDHGRVEILISLEGAEPPVGWVRVVRGPAWVAGRSEGYEVVLPAGLGCCGRCMR